MTPVLLFILGIVAALIGLAVSIALHELGHLFFAKRFGVRVPQYMIGFGPTVWSFRRGETEYGFKLLPLGGYISMIGMYPPAPNGTQRGRGWFNRLVQDGRDQSAESIPEGEDHRTFYRLPIGKRLAIMFAGPVMNFILGGIILAILAMGFGVYQPTTTLSTVYQCVTPAGSDPATSTCDEPSPAARAGLKPGDRILAVDGVALPDWSTFQQRIRASAGTTLNLTIERDGAEQQVQLTPRPNTVYVTDEFTGQVKKDAAGQPLTQTVGFVGFSAAEARQRQDLAFVGKLYWQNLTAVTNVIITMPQRVVDMFQAGFLGAERDPNGPMSVVGVGRITGEVVAMEQAPVIDRLATVLSIVGSLNIMLGLINLVPLPPFDGGHIAAAIWDGIRRWWARIRGKQAPGPFDTAKLLPVTMAVSVVLILLMGLFVYTDIVNPITLTG